MAKEQAPRSRFFDYEAARRTLKAAFERAEHLARDGSPILIDEYLFREGEVLFASATQSYREALVGCILAKLVDPDCDVRLPYVNHGDRAFNGRTLDETVVNPFFQERQIPCSKGPYLASIRRSVRFVEETAQGIRDKAMYRAFLAFVSALETADGENAESMLLYVLGKFIELRDRSNVIVSRVNRLSHNQTAAIVQALLRVPSGGLIPVLIGVATFQAVAAFNRLEWTIEWQGINVADRATGVGGDITIRSGGAIVASVEVTERQIDEARVASTFRTKISPHGLSHYVFLHTEAEPTQGARDAAERYFAQGHDVVFFAVDEWTTTWLGTLGPDSRALFLQTLLRLLEGNDAPASVKLAWNGIVQEVIG